MLKNKIFYCCLILLFFAVLPVFSKVDMNYKNLLTSEQFAQRIKTCTPGKYTKQLSIFGANVTIVQKIMGKYNGKCRYVIENYPPNENITATVCNFSEYELACMHKSFTSTDLSLNQNNSIEVKCNEYSLKNDAWVKEEWSTTMLLPKI